MKAEHDPICISVITPCLNGAYFIGTFFAAFGAQTVNADRYEIIVVDNGSDDGSFGMLQKYAEKLSNLRVYQYVAKRSSYAARNSAVAQSNGSVLAFTDIDCVPTGRWLEKIIDSAEEVMGGRLIAGPVELFAKRQNPNVFESYDLLVNLNQKQYSEMNAGATANLVVSRAVFDQVSGFAEVKSNGDIDFCRRCTERGSEIRFETEVRVRHPAIASFAGLAAKERRKGQGSAEIFLISQPDRTALLRYVMLQIVGLWLQPFQWRHIFKVFRSRDIRAENLRLSALILRLGWIHRWTILKTLLFRSSPIPRNNPSIGE